MNDLAKIEIVEETGGPRTVMTPSRLPIGSVITPMVMLSRAIESGAGHDMIAKLMDLQERYDKDQARKAFNKAIAATKAEIPVIEKNRQGHTGKYADFAAYASIVDPIIAKHGLGYRFRTEQGDKIRVFCILFHEDGHSETNDLTGPADTSGFKNAIQSIGSTLSYLQRYTLIQALGLAAGNDDDGKAAGGNETVGDEQAEQITALALEVKADVPKLLAFFKAESISDIRARDFDRAIGMLNSKRAKSNG